MDTLPRVISIIEKEMTKNPAFEQKETEMNHRKVKKRNEDQLSLHGRPQCQRPFSADDEAKIWSQPEMTENELEQRLLRRLFKNLPATTFLRKAILDMPMLTGEELHDAAMAKEIHCWWLELAGILVYRTYPSSAP